MVRSRSQVDPLETLVQVAEVVGQHSSVAELAGRMTRVLADHLGSEVAALWLPGTEGTMTCLAAVGLQIAAPEPSLSAEIAALASAGSLIANSSEGVLQALTSRNAISLAAARSGLASLALVPIDAGPTSHGLLEVGDPHPGMLPPQVAGALEVAATMFSLAARRTAASASQSVTEKHYEDIVEHSGVAILVDSVDGTLTYVNPSCADLFGYSPEEILGQSLRLLVHPDDVDRVMAVHRARVSGAGAPTRYDLRGVCRDGKVKVLSVTAVPRLEGSRVIGTQSYLWDVTQRRRAERDAALENQVRAARHLASGLAHQFNNLFQSMLGLVQAVDPGHVTAVADRKRLYEVEQHLHRAGQLTRQLILLSGQASTQLESLDLNLLVQGTAESLVRLLDPRLELRVELHPEPLRTVGDAAQLEQAVLNLAVNGADAMPNGGRLTLRAGREEDGRVWLSVTDTGPGVPDELRERVFEPFFSTKGSQGTGLGLAGVRNVASRHGGTVELRSRPGEGAEFRVLLPGLKPGEDRTRPRTVAEHGAGERVLVVEDEVGARVGMRAVLTRLGYRVAAVGSAREAEALALNTPFDVVLADVVLPDLSGAELGRRLSDRRPGLAVILMSGYIEDELVQQRIIERGVRFLQKPFNAETLGTEVQAALAAGRKRSP